jgi:hypothetical protein
VPMLYRSPLTRWVLAATGLAAGVLFTFGSEAKWRSTPSFAWLRHVPIPLQVWGLAFIVYALLLVFEQTRPAGFAVGAFLYAVFAVSLLATVGGNNPKNVFAIIALIDMVPFHILSIRTAEAMKMAHANARAR